MLNILKRAIQSPGKAVTYMKHALNYRTKHRNKYNTLIIVGIDPNGELGIIICPGYKMCFCFEAHPDRYNRLLRKYAKKKNIRVFNYAVTDFDGEIDFFISSNNDGASSSIGDFDETWLNQTQHHDLHMVKRVKVPCINLLNFCKEHNIDYIDDYISDIQGMDLRVLKTLQPMIDNRKIGSIKCEVTKDKYGNIYKDLPDNSESGFDRLLNKNYELVAKGFGILKDHKFDNIPEEAWEMDCKWKLKMRE